MVAVISSLDEERICEDLRDCSLAAAIWAEAAATWFDPWLIEPSESRRLLIIRLKALPKLSLADFGSIWAERSPTAILSATWAICSRLAIICLKELPKLSLADFGTTWAER